jgi:hypothetical protein
MHATCNVGRMAKDPYTALRVLPPAADRFRRLTRQLAVKADRAVTQSEALDAAAAYALEHVGDVAELLSLSTGTANE